MLSIKELVPFTKILNSYALFNFAPTHANNLSLTIINLASKHNLSIENYYKALLKNDLLKQELAEKLCSHFSSFFRNINHYNLLKEVLSTFLGTNNINIWYAGCSTGEDAYSHAIFLLHNKIKFNSLLATDLSSDAINFCHKANYSSEIVEKNKEAILLKKYMKKNGNYYEIDSYVKQHILFKNHNLASDIYPRNLDIIVCCNVLIYFDLEGQKKVVKKFLASLNRGGILIMGKGETLFNLDVTRDFKFVKTIYGCYYVKNL